MDSLTHTLIAVASMAISFYIGRRFGASDAFAIGLQVGAEGAIDKLVSVLNREYGITIQLDEEQIEEN